LSSKIQHREETARRRKEDFILKYFGCFYTWNLECFEVVGGEASLRQKLSRFRVYEAFRCTCSACRL